MTSGALIYILPAAFVLDYFVGDPRGLPHPVRWMGRAIIRLEPFFRKLPMHLTLSGAVFAAGLILCTWAGTFLVIIAGHRISPILGYSIEIILIYYTLASVSLEEEAMAVSDALQHQSIDKARQRVAMIVGRDVRTLDREGVARATVETVAENLVDGVLSPLFYAAIGGAPLAMAFKMVSTLDSMVGYKNEQYKDFGKVSARIDDVFNFLPARISVLMISISAWLLAGKGRVSFNTAVSEGRDHASPNAGYPEAAFAGALGVRLGGPNVYHGKLMSKPYIGKSFGPVKVGHVKKACDLMFLSSFLGVLIFSIIRI